MAIEPVLRGSKRRIRMTSPFFVDGLVVTFTSANIDISLAVKNSISDWMGYYPCEPQRIGRDQFINSAMLTFNDSENHGELTSRTGAELKKYTSVRKMYEAECLDPVIKIIQSGKLMQPVEWKEWDGYGSAHFAGYPPMIGCADTQWLYPRKRLTLAIDSRNDTRA